MKKYAAVILALILLIVSSGGSYAFAAKTVSSGQNATGWLTNVKYSSDGSSEAVTITAKNYTDYSLMKLTSPQRIVLDIFNVAAPGKQQIVNAGGKVIKRIRYAQFDSYTTRVVLEVNGEAEYGAERTDTGLVLFIGGKPTTPTQTPPTQTPPTQTPPTQTPPTQTPPTQATPTQATPAQVTQPQSNAADTNPSQTVQQSACRNIEYHNNGDRVYVTLKNAALTEGDEFLKELYTGTYDDSGKRYIMTFLTGQANLGNGIMEINDQYLRSIEVKTNQAEGTTSLIFIGTGKNSYFAYTRGSSGISSITILKPAAQKQKLVVIDAGHGGIATGAIYRNLLEKNLNLDIAKRLNTLLEKKRVKTYMLREDDSDIANYERAYIANNLNAKLYLSIHNNAMDDKSYRGSTTLYCPSSINNSFTGKNFAYIIQQKILGSLKTIDRKVVGRSDLIVLKATAMPAALAEVAFMTNKTDRSNLQQVAFRQKAAQALCDSVISALTKVK